MLTSANANRLLPWLSLAVVCGALGTATVAYPARDGDREWQLWLGREIMRTHAIPHALGPETFSSAGAPWTPQEWLFSLAIAVSTAHAAAWVVPLACVLAVTAAIAATVVRAMRRDVAWFGAVATAMLCVLAVTPSMGVRAQVAGWAGLSLELLVLEIGGPLIWLAPVIAVAWANLHASAMLAPVVAGIFAVTAVRDRATVGFVEVRRYVIATVLCAAAVFATPLGPRLPAYALGLLNSPIRHSIEEWRPTNFGDFAFAAGAFPLLLLLAVNVTRLSLRDRLLVACFMTLLFTAVRNVPLFALAVAPLALASLPRSSKPQNVSRGAAVLGWGTVALLAFMAVDAPLSIVHHAPPREQGLPIAPAHAVAATKGHAGRVFCEDFAWCSLFLNEAPGPRFFMDGRADPYPLNVWHDYLTVINGEVGWNKVLARWQVDAVLVKRDKALDALLAASPACWRAATADDHVRLYLKRDSGCRAIAAR